MIGMASQLRRIDLFVRESSVEQFRVALQMRSEQIDAAAMQRHYRRVRQFDSVPLDQIETSVLALGIAAVGLEQQSDRRETIALLVCEFSAQPEQERQSSVVQRLTRP